MTSSASTPTVGAADVRADVSMLNVNRSGVTENIDTPSNQLAYEEYLARYNELQAGIQPGFEQESASYQEYLNSMYNDLKSSYETDIEKRQKRLAYEAKYGIKAPAGYMSAAMLRETKGVPVNPQEYALNKKVAEYNAKLGVLNQVGNEELANIASAYNKKAEKLAASGIEFENYYNAEGRFKEELNAQLKDFNMNFNPEQIVQQALGSGNTLTFTPTVQMVKVYEYYNNKNARHLIYEGPASGAPPRNNSRGYSNQYTFIPYEVGNEPVYSGTGDWFVQKDAEGNPIKIVSKAEEYLAARATPKAGGYRTMAQYNPYEIVLEQGNQIDKIIKKGIYESSWGFDGAGQTWRYKPFDAAELDYTGGKLTTAVKRDAFQATSDTGGSSMSKNFNIFETTKIKASDGKIMFKESYAPFVSQENWASSGSSVQKQGGIYKQYDIDYVTGNVNNFFAPQAQIDKTAFYAATQKKLNEQAAEQAKNMDPKEIAWENPFTGKGKDNFGTNYNFAVQVVKADLPKTADLRFGNVRMNDAGNYVRYDVNDRGFRDYGTMGVKKVTPSGQLVTQSEFSLPFGYKYTGEAISSGRLSPEERIKNAQYLAEYKLANQYAAELKGAKSEAAKFKIQEKYIQARKELGNTDKSATQLQIQNLGMVQDYASSVMGGGELFETAPELIVKKTDDGKGFEFFQENKKTRVVDWNKQSKEYKQGVVDYAIKRTGMLDTLMGSFPGITTPVQQVSKRQNVQMQSSGILGNIMNYKQTTPSTVPSKKTSILSSSKQGNYFDAKRFL